MNILSYPLNLMELNTIRAATVTSPPFQSAGVFNPNLVSPSDESYQTDDISSMPIIDERSVTANLKSKYDKRKPYVILKPEIKQY